MEVIGYRKNKKVVRDLQCPPICDCEKLTIMEKKVVGFFLNT